MKSLLRLAPYLKKYRRTLLWGFVTVVGSNIFTVVHPLFLGRAIDAFKDGVDQGLPVYDELFGWAGLIVGVTLVAGFFTFLTRQTIIVTSRNIEFDLRNDLLAHLQKLSTSYFQNKPTGDLMAHATNDISAVRNVVGPGIMYPSDTMMTFVMVLTLMFVQDWQLTLFTLLPLPLVSIAVYRIGKQVNKKFNERQEQFSRLTTKAQENLSGIRVITSYVREAFEIGEFEALSRDYLKKNMVLALVQSIMWPLMFLLVGLSIVIAIYLGGLKVIDGQMSIGTLTAFLGYLTMLIWPMIAFGWVMNMLQQGAASMKRLANIFDTQPDITDPASPPDSLTALAGRIEFRDVGFRYKGTDREVLRNIDLTIEAGMTLAIVGPTGCGKSTLVNLIPRLHDVADGQILIDGHDVRAIPLELLRSSIGMVPQETFLFSETIRQNIRYGVRNDGETADIEQAAVIAQIDKDVRDFPARYDTLVGERGITLSGGQKQRTSIARALHVAPRILILDDALSAVDTHTEEEILRGLRGFMQHRTSILISHRVSTVKEADMIIVMEDGAIVERGDHDELVKLNGRYAELYKRQLLEQELVEL